MVWLIISGETATSIFTVDKYVYYESENDRGYEKGGQFFRPYILNNFLLHGLPFYSADEDGAFIRDVGT